MDSFENNIQHSHLEKWYGDGCMPSRSVLFVLTACLQSHKTRPMKAYVCSGICARFTHLFAACAQSHRSGTEQLQLA